MSFKVWFRKWIRSFYRLMMVGSRPRKSEKQRKKERERRLKAKYSSPNPFKKKRNYKKRDRSGTHKVLDALCGFMATSLGILLLPFGLFHWGYKSAKSRNSTKKSSGSNNSTTSTPVKKKSVSHQYSTLKTTPKHNVQASKPRNKKTMVKKTTPSVSHKTIDEKKPISMTYVPYTPPYEKPSVESTPPPPEIKVLDENTPKSTPRSEKDQYIRKRMIIAGASYCDSSVLEKLQIGTYFDLSREPDNPHDKDAVVLTLNGEKIGYVAKKDLTPFTVCLNLRRNIYGVITDIITENNFTKYEYETWFDNNR